MKTKNIISRVLDVMILAMFVLFLSSAGFQDRLIQGWYQQWLPDLNGSTIKDITFLDSLTGFAVTNTNPSLQAYILKTTNGGDNWYINYTYSQSNANWYFIKIGFVDANTGFAYGWSEMFQTTNGGISWNMIINGLYADDVSIINKDTMLAALSNGFDGGVYRSTNGGINWSRIWTNGSSGNPDKIYMYDKNLGFVEDGTNFMRRTTNGGLNWAYVTGEYYAAIKFYDSNTGWKVWDSIKKTTNGGLNWVAQITPKISNQFASNTGFSVLNKDTVWMVGARKYRAPVYKTTNSGLNWGYQFPDTTVQLYNYGFIQFVSPKAGWVYPASPNSLLHTKVGGNDTTFFTGISNNNSIEISDFELFQNYPNPFNSKSNIKYRISKTANIKITVYDLTGRELITLVEGKKNTGEYSVMFDGSGLPSGVYFYTLYADGTRADTKKMLMIK